MSDNERIMRLVSEAHALLDEAIETHVLADKRRLAGVVVLFSGGNDSTTLAHLFKDRATHAAHANTGIGIEQTRQYVRDTCARWGLPLLEEHTPLGAGYRDLILGRVRAQTGPNKGTVLWPGGFPGPAAHYIMYQKLKERALDLIRGDLVEFKYQQRVIYLAGRRADESDRRKGLLTKGPIERRGSTVWVSPLLNWTKLDLNAYRRLNPDVPRNEVSDLLHMSGECLCGAFAHEGELEEIGDWFPETADEIRFLEKEVAAAGVAPPERCKWGWGAGKEKPSRVGALCSSCDLRGPAAAKPHLELQPLFPEVSVSPATTVPLGAPKAWSRVVLVRAAGQCECTGHCGVTHSRTANRCPRMHGGRHKKHDVVLILAPKKQGLPLHVAAGLPDAELMAWCAECLSKAEKLAAPPA